MANTRTSNQFSVGLWKTLSTSQADYVTDLPILAFASSVTPYLALVVKDKSGDIHRILFSKRGKKDKIIDSFLPEENCSLPETLKEAIAYIDGRAEIEVSGNVTKENITRLINLGVDFVSSGALTHSAPILDISLKNLHPVQE